MIGKTYKYVLNAGLIVATVGVGLTVLLWWFGLAGHPGTQLVEILALIGAACVCYVRARATEGVGELPFILGLAGVCVAAGFIMRSLFI